MLRHVISEYSEGIPYQDSVGRFSLAGAQPKIALHTGKTGAWAVPQDATPTTHILKPVAGTIRRIDLVEQLTLRAAEYLGSEVVKSELQAIDGLDAAIAALIRSLPLEGDRREVGRRFYQAFVFNVVAGCTDVHAKNYSVMLEGESVRLAPLYDLVTYAPCRDGAARLDSAMSVDGEYALAEISGERLAAAGRQFGLGDEAAEIVASTRAGMVSAFESAIGGLARPSTAEMAIVDDLMRSLRLLPLVLA
jgi:serine/threonine-protein kinase HipA